MPPDQHKRVLLVDGYNVLRSGALYRDVMEAVRGEDYTHDAFNSAREMLVTDVATYSLDRYEATVVFDGGANPASTGEAMTVAGITVMFSPAGQDADSVIEGLAQKAFERGFEVLVITSDAQTQQAVFRHGVTRMSAAGFSLEMAAVRETLLENNPAPKVKNTLGERLDESARTVLERWARGERP